MREAVAARLRLGRLATQFFCWRGMCQLDMFESFEHRGRVFKEEVSSLKDQGSGAENRSEI